MRGLETSPSSSPIKIGRVPAAPGRRLAAPQVIPAYQRPNIRPNTPSAGIKAVR